MVNSKLEIRKALYFQMIGRQKQLVKLLENWNQAQDLREELIKS